MRVDEIGRYNFQGKFKRYAPLRVIDHDSDEDDVENHLRHRRQHHQRGKTMKEKSNRKNQAELFFGKKQTQSTQMENISTSSSSTYSYNKYNKFNSQPDTSAAQSSSGATSSASHPTFTSSRYPTKSAMESIQHKIMNSKGWCVFLPSKVHILCSYLLHSAGRKKAQTFSSYSTLVILILKVILATSPKSSRRKKQQ